MPVQQKAPSFFREKKSGGEPSRRGPQVRERAFLSASVVSREKIKIKNTTQKYPNTKTSPKAQDLVKIDERVKNHKQL